MPDTKYGKDIFNFDNIEKYNTFADKKYTNSGSFSNIPSKLYEDFTIENDYIILVLRVKNNGTNTYIFENDVFTDTAKGFFLGTLNASRKYLIDDIKSIIISDHKMTLIMDNLNFYSFEIGILIDPKFNERGSITLTKFIQMISGSTST